MILNAAWCANQNIYIYVYFTFIYLILSQMEVSFAKKSSRICLKFEINDWAPGRAESSQACCRAEPSRLGAEPWPIGAEPSRAVPSKPG